MEPGSLASAAALLLSLISFTYLVLLGLVKGSFVRSGVSGRAFRILATAVLLSIVVASVSGHMLIAILVPSPSFSIIALSAMALFSLVIVFYITAQICNRCAPSFSEALVTPAIKFLSMQASGYAPGIKTNECLGNVEHDLSEFKSGVAILGVGQEAQDDSDQREQRMIRAILSLEDRPVREIMIPRMEMVVVQKEALISSVAAVMLETGHSRLPAYAETVDAIEGIVHARDVLRFLGDSKVTPLTSQVIRRPFFVPENKRLDQLLEEFQEQRIHMAIVVDEYGGTAGLVTLEDLLEEIVGQIDDEFSRAETEVELLSSNEAIVSGRIGLDYINDLFNVKVDNMGVDTVGGVVYSLLGKVPNEGDEVVSGGIRIQVLSTVGRRIRRVRIIRDQATPDSK